MSGSARPRGPRFGIQALATAVVAATLVAVGRPEAALLAVVGGAIVIHAWILSPTFADLMEHRIPRAVGHLLSLCLLGVVFFGVVTPAGLLGRLLGVDHLGTPGWRRPTRSRDARRRPYARDRNLIGRSGRGWRIALLLLLTAGMAAALVGRVFDREGEQGPTALRAPAVFDPMDAPAMAGAPWRSDLAVEFGEADAGMTFDPYLSTLRRDYHGEHVNIESGERRSYRSGSEDQDLVEVWFFGGSAMYGLDGQRDLHTIPSEVVRLAEQDGLTIRARNFGQIGHVNFQETLLLARLLLLGERPDVVVFYDGINDQFSQLQAAYLGTGILGELNTLSAHPMRQILVNQYTSSQESPPFLTDPLPVDTPPTIHDVATAVIRVYGEGIELAQTLADRYDFTLVHTWQPTMFTKDQLVEGERALLEPLHLDAERFAALERVTSDIVQHLPPGVVDLTEAWDGTEQPVLNDQVHTNELGARLVAEAMYEQLRGRLGGGL